MKSRLLLIAAIIVISFVTFMNWKVSSDPLKTEAELFLMQRLSFSQEVGDVEEIHLSKATYVDSAINHNGEIILGYNLYDFLVVDSQSNRLIQVKVKNLEGDPEFEMNGR